MQTSEHPNVLIITLDSCRWDTFTTAWTPAIDSFCVTRRADAQATFTYAAHLAIYQGHMPNTKEPMAYYDRFTKPLFRITSSDTVIDSFASFPIGTKNILEGFRTLGYYAIGLGAMGWFRHPDLTSPFDEFHWTGINADLQMERFMSCISRLERPFVGLINFGETHEPYECGGQIPTGGVSRARSLLRKRIPTGFDNKNWLKQIRSCEFLDSRIGVLIGHLKHDRRGTIVVICADHGECFGEDGLHGHGFYHPKVMEVPLGIFPINCTLD